MIPPHFSSWRRVKVYGSVGACKTFPPCVKELSLKQVGVNMCEPFMSLADIYSPPPPIQLYRVSGGVLYCQTDSKHEDNPNPTSDTNS